MSDDRDLERDAHLRQALRHAPDADAAPPAQLRELILREAQAKAREGRPAAPAAAPGPLHRLWQWIGSPRFAAALAGVAVIGFAGLLWRERPAEEALPPRVAQQAPAAPAAVPTAVPAAPKEEAVPAAAAPAPAPVAAPAPVTPLRTEKPKLAPRPPRQDVPAAGVLADAAPAPAAPPPPATAAAPEAKRAEAADALAERSRDSARERSSEAVESRRSQAVAKAAAPAFSPAPAGALQADAPVAAIAQLRLAIGAEPTLWYWQRPAGPSRPFDNAISQWLGRAEAATRGRWQARPSLPAEAAPTELLLLRNGELSQRLRIADDALLWQRLDRGDVLRAPLDAATLAALRQALDAATP